TEITSDRWLTSNRKVYNNKGNPVKEYEPYYIQGYEYVDNEELNQFGVSPTLFYDPLQRLIRVDTPKGFFTKVEFTPWQERHYDENDTVKDSPYYAKPDLDEVERQALQKAELFYDTPLERIQDNLGRTVQEIESNKTTSGGEVTRLTTYYEWDIVGNQLSNADPRLSAASIKNFQMTYSMTNEVLKTVGVDRGTSWQLNNVLGNPIYSRDARNFEVRTAYDNLQRPVEVQVQGGDGATQLDQVVESLVYGESIDNAENFNLRGQVYQHYDQAGLLQVDGYNILGLPLTTKRQLRQEYKEEANWDNIDPSALQPTTYQTQSEYDALGRVTAQTDADNNVYTPTYHESGRLNQIQVQHQGEPVSTYVESIDYNPKGQRTKIVYGNGVTTDYEYEPTTFRLRRILTQRGAALAAAPAKKQEATPHWLCRLLPQFLRQPLGRVLSWGWLGFKGRNSRAADFAQLQDLNYTYDPVGNITQIWDKAWETVFNNNQQVEPVSKYTYDSLYRLIEATGREHPALSGQQEQYSDIPEVGFVQLPNLNNGQAVENYTRQYSYDRGGNLYQIAHQGTTPQTRNLTVSETSNRAVDRELLNGGTDVDAFFDANGNQVQMSGLQLVQWNYRDNLAHVTIIDREDSNNDAEYYVYDSSGSRIRKVTERYGSGGTMTHIEEVIYLGGVEIRLSRQEETVTEKRHCLRVMDDTTCVAIRNQWTRGEPPAGVKNPQVRYQLDNHLGSATMEVDDAGQLISYEEYFPYGGTAFVAGQNLAEVKLKHYRYSGKERDASTGLYYYGARYYAPWLGRWMSCDPAGTVDGLNLYAFVGGNPITMKDSGGMGKKSAEDSSDSEQPKKARLETASNKTLANTATSSSSSAPRESSSRDMPDKNKIENQFHIMIDLYKNSYKDAIAYLFDEYKIGDRDQFELVINDAINDQEIGYHAKTELGFNQQAQWTGKPKITVVRGYIDRMLKANSFERIVRTLRHESEHVKQRIDEDYMKNSLGKDEHEFLAYEAEIKEENIPKHTSEQEDKQIEKAIKHVKKVLQTIEKMTTEKRSKEIQEKHKRLYRSYKELKERKN
ncbi:MAG: hypothetical protein F6K21_11180, partial [Symploca sp. SIO2D2]|nr:hypothetical protein [Symploca sp. SIO2D2]